MPGPNNERCADCCCFEIIENGICGICHFHAPVPQMMQINIKIDTQLPRVDKENWCIEGFKKVQI